MCAHVRAPCTLRMHTCSAIAHSQSARHSRHAYCALSPAVALAAGAQTRPSAQGEDDASHEDELEDTKLRESERQKTRWRMMKSGPG